MHYIKHKRSFERDEVLLRSVEVHDLAYKADKAINQSSFVKIFGTKAFDALYKSSIFVQDEKQKFTVNTQPISALFDFLELKKWNAFL